MEEVFLRIEDYDGYYVSNLGNVLSSNFNNTGQEGLLKLFSDKSGYLNIGIPKKNHKRKAYTVHRLVAKAFIPNPNNLPCVHHINGNKSDNRVENLQWTDYKHHNEEHKSKRVAIIKNDKIIKIYSSMRDAEKDGFTYSCISNVCHGRQKTHKGYIFKFV